MTTRDVFHTELLIKVESVKYIDIDNTRRIFQPNLATEVDRNRP